MKVFVIADKCVGCKQCLRSCLYGAIDMVNNLAVINSKCTNCGACIGSCKFGAIAYEGVVAEKEKKDFSLHNGIMVVGEIFQGQLKHVSLELLGKAKELAVKLGEPACMALAGHKLGKISDEVLHYAPARLYLMDNPLLEEYQTDIYVKAMLQLIREVKPAIVLFGATHNGRDLAPRIASELYCGLTADCTELDIDQAEKILLQTRPAFGGNIMATIISPDHRPQMATVRPKVMKMPERMSDKSGEVVEFTPQIGKDDIRTRIRKVVRETTHHVNLEDAQVIVSFGRGIGDKSNIKLIEKLAETLNAEIGASRAVVDKGMISKDHQVGQTGKTVRPKLYIACGISGAVQHLAGMTGSDVVIAVNKDPQAPIFQSATYGILGDLKKVLPALTEEFKKYLKETE
ncbi:MAG: FAD-binding protein [Candidatus Wallbacteria bacterium]|nr:FAD-binding protein [Candidatus Wallbacteria bacterium]